MARNLRKFETENDYQSAELVRPAVSWVVSGDTVHFDPILPPTPPTHDYSLDYLTFDVLTDASFAFFKAFVFDPETGEQMVTPDIQYSLDSGSTWTTLSGDGETYTPTVTAGNKILWKGELVSNTNSMGVGLFVSTAGTFNAEGNVMSIVSGDSFTAATAMTCDYQLAGLFSSNNGLISAENLVLPATLSTGCYRRMFNTCSNLTTSPVLSAATVPGWAYEYMFEDCSGLTSVTCLATELESSTSGWLSNVSSTGTFTKAASMTDWETGSSGIPEGWTVVDA